MESLQHFIISLSTFINGVLIPFLFALALFFFIYHTFSYYIKDGGEDKEKAKTMAIYGVAAFVVLVSIWGLVNLLMSGLGLRNNDPITPDYFETAGGGFDSGSFFSVGFDLGGNDQNVRQNNFWGN